MSKRILLISLLVLQAFEALVIWDYHHQLAESHWVYGMTVAACAGEKAGLEERLSRAGQ